MEFKFSPGPAQTPRPGPNEHPLRHKALDWLRQQKSGEQPDSQLITVDTTALLEEVRIYQAELEVQNDELRASQTRNDKLLQRFSLMFRQAQVPMVLVDKFGLILDANETAIRLYGLSHQHFRRHFFYRLVDENFRYKFESALLRAETDSTRQEAVMLHEISMVAANGRKYIGDLSVLHLPTTEALQTSEFLCVFVDQTRLLEQTRALRESADGLKLYAKVFGNVSDAIMITDTEGNIVTVNAAFQRISGYSAEQVSGQNPRMLSSGHTPPSTYQALWSDLTQRGHWEGELLNRRANGEVYPQWTSIDTLLDENGRPWRYVALFHDLTLARKQEEQLRRLANEDALTGLPNRHAMRQLIAASFERARRTGSKVAILFADLDNFKNINDSLGHQAGDQTLVEVASRWKQRLRETDVLVRLGGDEFLIIAENLQLAEDASQIAHDLLESMEQPISLDEHEPIFVTSSIGICLFPDDGQDLEKLLQEADTAMYRAKTGGRNRYEFFSAEFMDIVREELSVATDLRHALKRGELFMEYQPLLPTREGDPYELEALVRWNHPVRGLVYPTDFIAIAEKTGLIHAVSEWVLFESCRGMRRLLDQKVPVSCVSVNVSFRDLDVNTLPALVLKALKESGLQGHHLKLELTESDLMRQPDQTRRVLEQIRSTGVRVAVDDFGTGFSSLAYLRLLPLDTLKIDRSFIVDMTTEENARSIVNLIVALAKSIGLNLVAEGVDADEQAQLLQELGVEYLQGWLYSKSVAESDVADVLRELPLLSRTSA